MKTVLTHTGKIYVDTEHRLEFLTVGDYGKPLVFIVDHIDGKASNNRRDNLRCICPNCDSQSDTYKSKNKNSDRVYYRENHR